MSSTTAGGFDAAPVHRMLAAQTRATLIYYWRVPTFFLFSMALPVMFYLFFGVTQSTARFAGTTVGTLVMAHMAVYAVSSILVFNVGIGRANNRAQKVDMLQRATPLPGWVAIAADAAGATVLALGSLAILYLFAVLAGHVSLAGIEWLTLTLRLVVGALPLLGLGLAIGYGVGTGAAPAVANLIYLPMSFASGIFIPLQQLPDFIARIAPYLPTYHYLQFVDSGLIPTSESMATAALWLAAWGAVLFAIAVRAYQADQARKFS